MGFQYFQKLFHYFQQKKQPFSSFTLSLSLLSERATACGFVTIWPQGKLAHGQGQSHPPWTHSLAGSRTHAAVWVTYHCPTQDAHARPWDSVWLLYTLALMFFPITQYFFSFLNFLYPPLDYF